MHHADFRQHDASDLKHQYPCTIYFEHASTSNVNYYNTFAKPGAILKHQQPCQLIFSTSNPKQQCVSATINSQHILLPVFQPSQKRSNFSGLRSFAEQTQISKKVKRVITSHI